MGTSDDFDGWLKGRTGIPDKSASPLRRFWKRILLRWPWLPWGCGAIVVVGGLTFLLLWSLDFWSSPEELYSRQSRNYLFGGDGQVGEVTQGESDGLETLAKKLALSREKAEELYEKEKMAILAEQEKGCRDKSPGKKEISPECEKELRTLAQRMGIEWPVKSGGTGEVLPSTDEHRKEVAKLLVLGRYKEARDLASKFPNDLDLSSVVQGIDAPLAVELGIQFQRPGEKPSRILPIDSEELANLILTHKDSYRFFFRTGEKAYLYIFQIDELGGTGRPFPDPQIMETGNPVHPSGRYQVPSIDWFSLPELTGSRQSMNQTWLIIASRWAASDVDDAYSEVHRATEKGEWEKALLKLKERLNSRKTLQKPGIFFKELVLIQGK